MAFPERQISAQISLSKALALGILRGLWTLDDLDQPPPGYRELRMAMERAAIKRSQPPAPYRNLAREWIDTNRRQWDELLQQSLEAENLDHLPTEAQILAAVGVSAA